MASAVVPLKSEIVPVAKLIGMGAPYNPRRIAPEQLAALRRSLRTFGVVEPVVANRRSGRIVGGHQRVRAAEAEGIETLPVVWVDLDETGERQLNLALNRISGEWDEEKLGALLLELSEAGADIALTGFDDSELQKILAELRRAQRGDPDDVPEPPAVPVSKPGDLYVLGKHRLLCGDTTNAADVKRLMDGSKADALLTDPPYNVDYKGGTKQKLSISNDAMDEGAYLSLLVAALRAAVHVLRPGGAFYCWHADSHGLTVRSACASVGLIVRQCLIWVKSSLVLGRQDYQWRHEPCLYGWKDGAAHIWLSDRSQTTVLEFEKPARNEDHPTTKPVALFAQLLGNSCKVDGIVLDPFAGSGTTIIAAEQLGRRCFSLEIDPTYVDVAVQRWERFTGEKAFLEAVS
jgi:site-specific DNA-methyltransferase (adenine-specific)